MLLSGVFEGRMAGFMNRLSRCRRRIERESRLAIPLEIFTKPDVARRALDFFVGAFLDCDLQRRAIDVADLDAAFEDFLGSHLLRGLLGEGDRCRTAQI